MTLHDLQTRLVNEFPISSALGINIQEVSEFRCSVVVPLAPNRNHKGTVFGGSIYSSSVFSCYGLFLFALRAQGFVTDNVVISEGQIRYLKPVTKDFVATAGWEFEELLPDFFQSLRKKGKSRTSLTAQIKVEDVLCAELKAQFVAHL